MSIDTVDGVVVTTNGRSGQWSAGEEWMVREEFRLGGTDGPEEELFGGQRMSVSVGPDGRLYVLDMQAADIRVFDRRGAFVRRFGGEGPGPAELQSPSAMGWAGAGRLWVANGFNGRYTVFDTTGTLVKTVPRELRVLARWQHRLVFNGSGAFVDEGGGNSAVHLRRVDTAGVVLDTLPWIKKPDRPGAILTSSFDRDALAYLPRLVWTVAEDGTVWFTRKGELRLVQRTWEGDTLRIIETRHRETTLDSETERMAEREFSKLGLARSDYTLVRPVAESIHVLEDGHVLVQIIDEVGRGGRVLDVFDPEGRFLGTMDLGFRMSRVAIPAFVGDTIVAVSTGEMDVPYVIRSTIRRSGS